MNLFNTHTISAIISDPESEKIKPLNLFSDIKQFVETRLSWKPKLTRQNKAVICVMQETDPRGPKRVNKY